MVNQAFNQQHQCPFFFTKDGLPIPMVGWFREKSAFVVASGPSFGDINKNLLKKPGIWTMTTNNAVASFRGNAAIVVDEPARFTMSLWLDPTIMKFVPANIMSKPLWDNRYLPNQEGQQWNLSKIVLGDCPNVIGYRRNVHFTANQFLHEDTVNWGNHKKWGGGRSVLLATMKILFLLGFRRVYLLGVDFEMNEEKKYHFDEERHRGAIKGNTSTYKKMMQWFKDLQPYFLAENFVVKNCNPDSKLTAFPFIPFADAIEEATMDIGDPSKERTKGLYASIEDKQGLSKKTSSQVDEQRIVSHNHTQNQHVMQNQSPSASTASQGNAKQTVASTPQNLTQQKLTNKPNAFFHSIENVPSPNPSQITVDEYMRPIDPKITRPINIEKIKM